MAATKTSGRAGSAKGGRGGAAPAIPQLAPREIRPAPVVLLSGPEDYFADLALDLLRRTLRLEDPSLEVTELDAATYAAGALVTFVSPSLFMEPRLVIVEGVEKCTDALVADSIRYIETPVEGTTIVFRHSSGARGKKLLDAIRAAKDVAIEVPCPKPKANELLDIVHGEFRAEHRRIEPQAASQLVAAFNTDLAELASACRQLIAVTTDDVTERDVERYYGGRVETTGFKIADAAIAGRLRDALGLARHGMSQGVHPVPIVAAVAGKLRLMAKVSDQRGSDAQLAGAAGAAPWQVGQARRDLRDWDDRMLGRAIVLTAETDQMVKGGSRDAAFAVERLLRRIAARDL
ncbi:DNA polymerase III subunit delta [Pseudoclavibacter endophyticus]|uniref:DNA-directed DNA polymerase n=1 Tax=Pseudoclavibacter endophyticus TaxID=1778590 RepID=A0A6H9WGZ7_9MICO|nr:DNA polymerase III subunit delta [Pseudoclavibacter endophyticus]KAB1646881.1 DNA polymerase III subunit delta [Pseudoclavibacter endophyticus]GGA74746.1 DNA polymerase III subunit delta [Pseudoclavibacter endophyticus]